MLPKVSDILYIQVDSGDREEASKQFKARIAEAEEDCLYIEIPLEEKTGKLKKLNLGDKLSAYYVNESGVKHSFRTFVIGFKDDGIRMVSIRKPVPEQIAKAQRRKYLRVGAELEVAVKVSGQLRFVAVTKDVSGGGLSFVCDGQWSLRNEQPLFCWLLLTFKNGSIGHIPFTGEIVRLKRLMTGEQMVMLQYTDIADTDRQTLIRFCFERQFQMRKH
ncbi:PilZ domain-containing protein [Paenibacillus sp. MSJ-34]|nr:PilZ domain-containing protein [Paenibacillus sp. MSJ-34]MBU5443942.1 PilZ domain-containing protein [Paenibacillus sp. MSJ-34]